MDRVDQVSYMQDETAEEMNAILSSHRYSDSQIESKANDLLRELWHKREQMWGWCPTDPTIIIDPAKALELLGYDFFLEENLSPDQSEIEVAGIIYPDAKRVHVSKKFPMSVLSFTAAHELGHAVLHELRGTMHRDRAMNGEALSRDFIEREADKFATYFLMPAKLVRARFVELFGTDSFALTEQSAFALSCSSLSEVKKKHKRLRDISRLLAGTKSYGERNVYSLADQFRVSVEAMAIRLEELALIEVPQRY